MQCSRLRTLLYTDFLDQELDEKKTEDLKSHLEHCPDCKKAYKALMDNARAPFLNIKNIAAPETLWSRIESRLQEEEKRGLFSRIKESLYTYRISAVSLAFAAVAAVLLFVSPGPPNNASDFIEDNMSYLASLRNTSQEPDNDLDFGTTIEYFFM